MMNGWLVSLLTMTPEITPTINCVWPEWPGVAASTSTWQQHVRGWTSWARLPPRWISSTQKHVASAWSRDWFKQSSVLTEAGPVDEGFEADWQLFRRRNQLGKSYTGFDWLTVFYTFLFCFVTCEKYVMACLHCLTTRLDSTRLNHWVESDRAVWTLLRRDLTQLNSTQLVLEFWTFSQRDQLTWVESCVPNTLTTRLNLTASWIELSWVG